jgi:dihydroorotate dehydrogenase electron transfer subunit
VYPDIIDATILHNQEISPGVFHAILESPFISREARPGQFIMLRVGNGTDPLLRRPFSISGTDTGTFEILYQVRGKATNVMTTLKSGEAVSVIGPLGNGFKKPGSVSTLFLVAGGIGIAPLLFWGRFLQQRFENITIKLFMGGKSAADIALLEYFVLREWDIFRATEDGTKGFHGLVTDLVVATIGRDLSEYTNDRHFYGCGPNAMLKTLGDIACTHAVPCQVSLEAMMACGVGACLGCVVDTKDRGYKRVCAEGPVFDSSELVLTGNSTNG